MIPTGSCRPWARSTSTCGARAATSRSGRCWDRTSAHTEKLLAELLETLENRSWLERNSEALREYGKMIAKTGLAGEEFDRI